MKLILVSVVALLSVAYAGISAQRRDPSVGEDACLCIRTLKMMSKIVVGRGADAATTVLQTTCNLSGSISKEMVAPCIFTLTHWKHLFKADGWKTPEKTCKELGFCDGSNMKCKTQNGRQLLGLGNVLGGLVNTLPFGGSDQGYHPQGTNYGSGNNGAQGNGNQPSGMSRQGDLGLMNTLGGLINTLPFGGSDQGYHPQGTNYGSGNNGAQGNGNQPSGMSRQGDLGLMNTLGGLINTLPFGGSDQGYHPQGTNYGSGNSGAQGNGNQHSGMSRQGDLGLMNTLGGLINTLPFGGSDQGYHPQGTNYGSGNNGAQGNGNQPSGMSRQGDLGLMNTLGGLINTLPFGGSDQGYHPQGTNYGSGNNGAQGNGNQPSGMSRQGDLGLMNTLGGLVNTLPFGGSDQGYHPQGTNYGSGNNGAQGNGNQPSGMSRQGDLGLMNTLGGLINTLPFGGSDQGYHPQGTNYGSGNNGAQGNGNQPSGTSRQGDLGLMNTLGGLINTLPYGGSDQGYHPQGTNYGSGNNGAQGNGNQPSGTSRQGDLGLMNTLGGLINTLPFGGSDQGYHPQGTNYGSGNNGAQGNGNQPSGMSRQGDLGLMNTLGGLINTLPFGGSDQGYHPQGTNYGSGSRPQGGNNDNARQSELGNVLGFKLAPIMTELGSLLKGGKGQAMDVALNKYDGHIGATVGCGIFSTNENVMDAETPEKPSDDVHPTTFDDVPTVSY